MTLAQPPQAEIHAAPHTVSFHGFSHIVRTGGMKTAGGRQQRRDPPLVETQNEDYEFPHRATNLRSSFSTASQGASYNALRGLITMSHCGAIEGSFVRIASRILRFMKFLRTARPNARGVVNPTRGPAGSWLARRKAVKRGPEYREPLSYTRRNSLVFSKRFFFGNGNCRVRSGRTTSSSRSEPRAHRRRSTSSGPWLAGAKEPAVRPWSPCVRGSRGSSRAYGCSVETYVLALLLFFSAFRRIGLNLLGCTGKTHCSCLVEYPKDLSLAVFWRHCQTGWPFSRLSRPPHQETLPIDGTCYTSY